jgi:hypothetical protein
MKNYKIKNIKPCVNFNLKMENVSAFLAVSG